MAPTASPRADIPALEGRAPRIRRDIIEMLAAAGTSPHLISPPTALQPPLPAED